MTMLTIGLNILPLLLLLIMISCCSLCQKALVMLGCALGNPLYHCIIFTPLEYVLLWTDGKCRELGENKFSVFVSEETLASRKISREFELTFLHYHQIFLQKNIGNVNLSVVLFLVLLFTLNSYQFL